MKKHDASHLPIGRKITGLKFGGIWTVIDTMPDGYVKASCDCIEKLFKYNEIDYVKGGRNDT